MSKYFRGSSKKRSFFEGWYFKHIQDGKALAIIPGIHFDHMGRRFAFIQVITHDNSYYIPYPFSAFHVSTNHLHIQIAENHFSNKGLRVFIETPQLSLKGTIHYGSLDPIDYDIMGPFGLLPFMECHHGVISMSHTISGYLELNDETIDFSKGIGYIEKDWGRSFPKSYLWTQCNSFRNEEDCSILVSVAHIPFLVSAFEGCICAIHYRGKHYRIATYLGARIIKCTESHLILQQGHYILEVCVLHKDTKPLKAPLKGNMTRIIHENAVCTALYKFRTYNEVLFELTSDEASFEFAK